MKLKYYLRGIGIGMIVTTIILMIAFAVHKEQPLTDEEIRTRAAELGMVMPEDLPSSDKLADTEQRGDEKEGSGDSQEESQSAQDPAAEDVEADAAGEKDAKNQSDSAAPVSDNNEEDKTQPEVIEQVEVTIVGGEYSDDVCKKLKKAGVIEDADDFNKYLAEGGFDNLIQPGNYVIPLDADYDTIIKLITEKKR